MSAPGTGTLLGDLAASDMGPLVADSLDAESCRCLALSGVQGRALTRRRSALAVDIREGSVVDLAAEARVDSEGWRRARDCCTLHVRLAPTILRGEPGWPYLPPLFPKPNPWTLKVPGSVLECKLVATTLSHAHLARVREALPPRACLDVQCSVLEQPFVEQPFVEPVCVRSLMVDWMKCPPGIPAFVSAAHLVSLDIGWMHPDPTAMCCLPSLRSFGLTSHMGQPFSASAWLVWGCALPRLESITLTNVQQERLPDLSPNDSMMTVMLGVSCLAEGETTNLRGCLSAFRALETLVLSRLKVHDICRDLDGLRVTSLCISFIPRKPDMGSCSLPRLRKLLMIDEERSDFHLPSAPVLEQLTFSCVWRRTLEWTCEKLAASATALPRLTEVILSEGIGEACHVAKRPARCWSEMGWMVGPAETPFNGHCLTRPRRRAA